MYSNENRFGFAYNFTICSIDSASVFYYRILHKGFALLYIIIDDENRSWIEYSISYLLLYIERLHHFQVSAMLIQFHRLQCSSNKHRWIFYLNLNKISSYLIYQSYIRQKWNVISFIIFKWGFCDLFDTVTSFIIYISKPWHFYIYSTTAAGKIIILNEFFNI